MNRLCVPPVATGSSITAPRFVDASFVSAGAACDVGGVDCTPRSVGVRAGGRRARGVRIAARQTTVCSVWIVLKAACGAQSAQRVRACPPPPPPPPPGGPPPRPVSPGAPPPPPPPPRSGGHRSKGRVVQCAVSAACKCVVARVCTSYGSGSTVQKVVERAGVQLSARNNFGEQSRGCARDATKRAHDRNAEMVCKSE
jgi:hypothetical protein